MPIQTHKTGGKYAVLVSNQFIFRTVLPMDCTLLLTFPNICRYTRKIFSWTPIIYRWWKTVVSEEYFYVIFVSFFSYFFKPVQPYWQWLYLREIRMFQLCQHLFCCVVVFVVVVLLFCYVVVLFLLFCVLCCCFVVLLFCCTVVVLFCFVRFFFCCVVVLLCCFFVLLFCCSSVEHSLTQVSLWFL